MGLHARKPLTEIGEGVYEVEWGLTPIRIIVAGRLPQTEPNALLHLFSASEALLEYGRQHCRIHSPEKTSLLSDLFGGYKAEGLEMPYTMDEFMKEIEKRTVQRAPFDVRLDGIPPAKRLEGIPQAKRLEGLTPEDREVIPRRLDDTPPT